MNIDFLIHNAAEPERILAAVAGVTVKAVLLTHAHHDRLQALDQVRQTTGAPVGVHPADTAAFGVHGDFDLTDGDVLTLGGHELQVVHTPGHTPGSVCLRFDRCAIVGDTFFPGGSGHSARRRPWARYWRACNTRSSPGLATPPPTRAIARQLHWRGAVGLGAFPGLAAAGGVVGRC